MIYSNEDRYFLIENYKKTNFFKMVKSEFEKKFKRKSPAKSSIQKLHFRLRTLIREGKNNPQCAYWAFSSTGKQKPGTYSRGRWSTKGCELKGFHPPHSYRLAYDYINCSCDRSIGIGVLMDVTSNEVL